MSEVVDFINKELKVYGSNQYNDPLFRVVFSDEQTERRDGVYEDYSGGIYLRTVREIREVRKYPWIKRKWILERWASGELSYHPSLVTDKNGVYICVYVFQDVNGNYLPPLLKVCQILINQLLHPVKKIEAINRDIKTEEKQEKEEIDAIELELKIESDESATKDMRSYRDTASVGYVKDKIKGENNE